MRNFIDIIMESAEGPRSLIDVANWFLDTRDDLLDHDESGKDDLNEATALEIIKREYVSGTCSAFAVALHDKTGFPIVGINGGMHVAVQAPNGDIIDFMGANPLTAVLARYGMPDAKVMLLSREEVVDDVRLGDGDDNDPWDEINIAKFVMNTLGRW